MEAAGKRGIEEGDYAIHPVAITLVGKSICDGAASQTLEPTSLGPQIPERLQDSQQLPYETVITETTWTISYESMEKEKPFKYTHSF